MGSSGEQRAAREGEGTVETPFTHRADGPNSLHDAGPLTEDLRRVLAGSGCGRRLPVERRDGSAELPYLAGTGIELGEHAASAELGILR